MASHEATCPACGSALRVDVYPHTGGSAEESVGLSVALSSEEHLANELARVQAEAENALAKARQAAVNAAQAVLAAHGRQQQAATAAERVSTDKVVAAQAVLSASTPDEIAPEGGS